MNTFIIIIKTKPPELFGWDRMLVMPNWDTQDI